MYLTAVWASSNVTPSPPVILTIALLAPLIEASNNGEEIDEFIREALALRYLMSYEVNTVP